MSHTYGQEEKCILGFGGKARGKTYKLMTELARDITFVS